MLSIIALMASMTVSYVERFNVGDSVDLNQGIYVCKTGDDSILEKLAHVKNANKRRSLAESMGCRFSLADNQQVVKIISHNQDICLEQTVGYSLEKSGKVPVTQCGIEGHRITVRTAFGIQNVIWVSLDADYD